ncbi:LysR family transcriptional regulator [Ktedonosporobacter rubrisoli]|uniref:LysR family transcriptional regulator n=1 Tax=Ktedonosporobacter rubrisoli TaxID=2509675 RepID=A0A4P6JTF0_KTERU|nr:LysR family transcriptional regulator [Ktedonosporobacter rubrisoli]QBD78595.1 LysR family transcriptional regulator [Ktedonosporobacter rubrisoli]
MNLHQLRIFCCVVEHGTYTRAAEALFMTQPAVSLQVRALERSLQVKLLERVNQQLTVTEAGQALYQCAIPMLNAEAEAERVLAEIRGAARGRLVVAANTTGGMYVVPPLLATYKERHPDSELLLQIDPTDRLVERVRQGIIDLGFACGDIQQPELIVEKIGMDTLTLILSPRHPLAAQAALPLEQVAMLPFVVPEATSRTRQFIEQVMRKHGYTLKIAMHFQGTEPVKKAVESNLGAGIVSSKAVIHEVAAGVLRAIPIIDLELKRPFIMFYRQGKYFGPLGRDFMDYMRKQIVL